MDARRFASLAVVALTLAASAADAGALARLSADHLHRSGDQHVLVVRATDAEGAPVEGLEHAFTLERDGQPVADLQARSPFGGARGTTVAVVVDGEMLMPGAPGGETLPTMLHALASGLGADDHVRVLSAGRETKSKDWRAAALVSDPTVVRELRQEGEPHLRDAIGAALDELARVDAAGRALVVVTRMRDAGSRRTAAELAVAAIAGGGIASVEVWWLGSGGDAELAAQLDRLASATGGALRREAPAATAVANDALALARRYEVRFRAGGGGSDEHTVVVRASDQGRVFDATLRYANDAVADPAWWASPLVWVVVVLGIAIVLALLWWLQPKQLALLVVQGGDDDGQWFEIFEVPARIGAREDSDVLLAGETVSNAHCQIERDGRALVIIDLSSEFGTFVNGARVTRHVLEDDDVIRIGRDVELVYEAR